MRVPALCAAQSSWRCGQNLINVGDSSFEVLARCGKPDLREQVGYIIDDAGHREIALQEWVYGSTNGAYCVLTFAGTILKDIEFRHKP